MQIETRPVIGTAPLVNHLQKYFALLEFEEIFFSIMQKKSVTVYDKSNIINVYRKYRFLWVKKLWKNCWTTNKIEKNVHIIMQIRNLQQAIIAIKKSLDFCESTENTP